MTKQPLEESTDAAPTVRAKKKRQRPVSDGPTITPVRTRRSGAWLAASIAVILLGALASVFVFTNLNNGTQVFVSSGEISRGSTITENDLTTITIAEGQSTTALPISDADKIVGTVAAVDIPAGALITKTSITDALPVPEGRALVGLTLTPAQLPAQTPRPGDTVILVPIPAQGAAVEKDVAAETVNATVSQVRSVEGTQDKIVDVYVSNRSAATVTAQAAAGTIAIYLVAGDK